MHSPNYSLHSAANRLLRSKRFFRWQQFNASEIGDAGFSVVDADERFNNYLPSDKEMEFRRIASYPSAACIELPSENTSNLPDSHKGDDFNFPKTTGELKATNKFPWSALRHQLKASAGGPIKLSETRDNSLPSDRAP